MDNLVLPHPDEPVEITLGTLLKQRNETICSAESCTGGKIAVLLNHRPGSSAFYYGSIISYDNSIKQRVLGVPAYALDTYGAVSEPIVRQMAEGVRDIMNTTYSVATSGVAGPDGGTPDKPIGTVWMAISTPWGTYTHRFQFPPISRQSITDEAAQTAVLWLLHEIRTHFGIEPSGAKANNTL